VLLLGEIDLSVGIVSGLCAAVMAVLNVKHGWGPVPAILAAVVAGAAIGAFQGTVITRFGIPSFVVTLAGLLGWQGVMLWVLGNTGTVNINDKLLVDIAGTFFDDVTGWILGVIAIAAYAWSLLGTRRRRLKAGLEAPPTGVLGFRIALVAIAVVATILVCNSDRGLPLALVILLGFVVLFQWITTRTKFGRYIYAVGGNTEAARRAGINVANIKTACFIFCSTLAIVAGILLASRDNSVSPTTGGAQTLLYAVGAAVIGGTSLFGGRGRIYDAVTGGLVVAIIANGLPLVTQKSGVQFIINGLVLLLAASVDAISRRRAAATGR